MAYDFPNSPSNGDTVTIQVTYTFNSSDNAWATSVVSPPNPAIGISSGAPTLTSGISAASIKTLLGVPTDISNVVDGAPTALDTLNKIAAAINDDASFHTTVTAALAGKAPLASPAFTGAPPPLQRLVAQIRLKLQPLPLYKLLCLMQELLLLI